jgi:SAM-dependent methyltransferase
MRTPSYWWDCEKLEYPKQMGFKLCTFCGGFMTYDCAPATDSDSRQFYETRYRVQGGAVKPQMVVSNNHKNIWHSQFLAPLGLRDWSKDGWSVLDIGAGNGYFLQSLRDNHGFKQENLFGTEWTKALRRWAGIQYGVELKEAPDASRKYDLISLYHVLEHMVNPREKLMEAKGLLSDRGLIYLGLPTWTNRMDHSGEADGKSFEGHLQIEHVNVFTRPGLLALLKSVGLEVVAHNTSIYDDTLLLKPCEPSRPEPCEHPDEVVKRLQSIKDCYDAMNGLRPDKAVEIYPHFPDAWIMLAGYKDNFRDMNKKRAVLNKGLALMPDSHKLMEARGLVEMQDSDEKAKGRPMGVTNALRLAEEYFAKTANLRAWSEDGYHRAAIMAYVYRGDVQTAVNCWRIARRINPYRCGEWDGFIGCAIAGEPLPIPEKEKAERPDPTNVTVTAIPRMEPVRRAMQGG